MKDKLKRKLDTDPLDRVEQRVGLKKKKQKKDQVLKKQQEQSSNEILNGNFEQETNVGTENLKQKGLKKKKKKQVKEEESTTVMNEKITDHDEEIKEIENETEQQNGQEITLKKKSKMGKDEFKHETVGSTVESQINEKPKKNKDKIKKKKKKDMKIINVDDLKENQKSNEVTEKDTENDELLYRLLGDKPDKISTLNGFQKKLIRLSLLAADDVEKSDDQIKAVSTVKEKYKKEFRNAVDRGIAKGVPIIHIDTGHSRSTKFDDDSD